MQEFYKGFDLITQHYVEDYESDTYYLRHRKTGLEVFYMENKDEENLFGFTFRTPSYNAKGCAHIIEHSVLCGSEKFPLKEPFTTMLNQSVQTFLNAFTLSSLTSYPAASMNRTDYFNLMDVYADAVFFPKLSEQTFMQEGHHLEVDKDGNASLQGVVYNEMKGAYSSFYEHLSHLQFSPFLRGTCFEKDSGGDPLDIPSLTYEEFCAFHKKWYTPNNCLLFLYGNINIKDQIDFLSEKLLTRLEAVFPKPEMPTSFPYIPPEIAQMKHTKDVGKDHKVFAIAPDTDAQGSAVSVNWKLQAIKTLDDYFEIVVLAKFLCMDSAVMRCTLEESKLGSRFFGGKNIAEIPEAFLELGLYDVEQKDFDKVKDLIFATLQKICNAPVPKEAVEALTLSMDFDAREINRSSGPFSIQIMEHVIVGWNNGREPYSTITFQESLKNIKERLQKDPSIITSLLRKYLLKNEQYTFAILSPSKEYLALRNQKEEALINALLSKSNKEELKRQTEELHIAQLREETEEELSCLPSLRSKDLSNKMTSYNITHTHISGADGSNVNVFFSEEATNGIVYTNVCFPVDMLSPQEYKTLSYFASCVTNTGWGKKSWHKCTAQAELCAGSFNAFLYTSAHGRGKSAESYFASVQDEHFTCREWLNISMDFPVEKTKEALTLLAEALCTMSFADTERIRQLATEKYNARKANIVNSGSLYALNRAEKIFVQDSSTSSELWNGLSSQYAAKNIITQGNTAFENMAEHFSRIYSIVKQGGAIVHVTADKKSMQIVQKELPSFIRAAELTALKQRIFHPVEEYTKALLIPGETNLSPNETFIIGSQVGFSAAVLKVDTSLKEAAHAAILAHYLYTNQLWSNIRVKGSAYGAHAYSHMFRKIFAFSTYRDPAVKKSIKVIGECLKDVAATQLSPSELERAICGTWGKYMDPESPAGRGTIGLSRALYGLTQDTADSFIQNVLSASPKDIQNIAQKIEAAYPSAATVLIGDSSLNTDGKAFVLPD